MGMNPAPASGRTDSRRSPGRAGQATLLEGRLAARSLRRRPWFSLAVAVILGAGVAGAATGWTAIRGALLAPLGYAEEDRLVGIYQKSVLPSGAIRERFALSDAMIVALRERVGGLEEVAYLNGATGAGIVLERNGLPAERVSYTRPSWNFFTLLGVQAIHGRVIEPRDRGRDVVLLSHRAWERYFGQDPGVIGRALRLGAASYEVVGVLPPAFRWLSFEDPVEFWIPQDLEESRVTPFFFQTVARLAPDATLPRVEAEASALFVPLMEPVSVRDLPSPLATVVPVREDHLGKVGPQLQLLAGAMAFMFVLAVLNAGLLLLIRTAGRGRESGVRAALGAPWSRVAAPVVAEVGLLSLLGGVMGAAGAYLALTALSRFSPSGIPRIETLGFSVETLAVAVLLTLSASAVLTAGPLLALRRLKVRTALAGSATPVGEGLAPRSLRGSLVLAEVALTVLLLVGSGLMARTFVELQGAELGFDPGSLLQGRITLPVSPFFEEMEEGMASGGAPVVRVTEALPALREELRERLLAHPQVQAVGVARDIPLSGRYGGVTPFIREGWEDREMPPGQDWIAHNTVDPEFLPLLGAKLRAGRWLDEGDGPGAPPVALISQALADRFWPGENPVGQRFRDGGLVPSDGDGFVWEEGWMTVVGVVRPLREWDLREAAETVYYPVAQKDMHGNVRARSGRAGRLAVIVSYSGGAGPVADHLRRTVAELLPGVPVDDLVPFGEVVDRWLREPRFYAGFVTAFGLLALILAAGGIAAVIGFGISQRTREIGLRMALGARASHILRMVTGETLVLVGAGAVLGVWGSVLLTRFLEELLYRVEPGDPATLAGVLAVFLGTALLTAWIPARQALRVDPAEALRAE